MMETEVRKQELPKELLFVNGVKFLKGIASPDQLAPHHDKVQQLGIGLLGLLPEVPFEIGKVHITLDDDSYTFLRAAAEEGVLEAYIKKFDKLETKALNELGLYAFGLARSIIQHIDKIAAKTVPNRIQIASRGLWGLASEELKKQFKNKNPLLAMAKKSTSLVAISAQTFKKGVSFKEASATLSSKQKWQLRTLLRTEGVAEELLH